MKTVKKTAEYTVLQRRDGRYAVKGADKKLVNGEEKVKILLAEELIKVTLPAEPEPEPEAEESAEEVSAEAGAEESAEGEEEKADEE